MKLLSYKDGSRATWGAVVGNEQVVDLSGGGAIPTLRAALEQLGLEGIQKRLDQVGTVGAKPLTRIEFLPVITNPPKILCIGLNYEAHRLEAKRAEVANPTIFVRFATSQIGHGQQILRPPESTHLDFEGEIAVIIGKGGRRISQAQSWDHIAGYAPYNDASIRDWQYHTTQWTAGKNFDTTGPFGPWMVTRDEIADGAVMEITTRLNGEVMQRGSTDQLIFSIPRLIEYCSSVMTLEAGDVIVTGTPSGVGVKREPQLFMKAGDRIEIEVSRLGTLSNVVADEQV